MFKELRQLQHWKIDIFSFFIFSLYLISTDHELNELSTNEETRGKPFVARDTQISDDKVDRARFNIPLAGKKCIYTRCTRRDFISSNFHWVLRKKLSINCTLN